MGKRSVLALLLVVALSGAGPGPAAAAPALIPPAEVIPVKEIRPGMKGYGLTVFRGTRPSRFAVTVIDVLRRNYLGQDMLLVRLSGGPITERGAKLIAGMSGSPIYLGGRLAGAVSMGYSFPGEPVAIVTPIEAMAEALDPRLPAKPMLTTVPTGPASPTPLGVTAPDDDDWPALLSPPQASAATPLSTLRPLITPLYTHGLSPAGSRYLARLVSPFGLKVAAGTGGKAPAGAIPLQPGSAVGVSLVSGDIDITTSGTLTYRKGNRVLAFGHPMYQIGAVDLPMTTVYVHDIWCGLEQSFRLDAAGKIVGAITQDRPFSVAGVVGKMPRLVPVEIGVRDATTGRSQFLRLRTVDHPMLTPGLVQLAAGEALLRVRPHPGESMARVQLAVEAEGFPTLVRKNTVFDYFDPNGFEYAALRDLNELLSLLSTNPFGQVPIRRVRLSVTITPGRKTAALERLAVDRNRVAPGETVRVTAVLRPWRGSPEVRTLEVKIPDGAPEGRAYLSVSGGASGLPRRPAAGSGLILILGGGRTSASEPVTSVGQLVRRYLEREHNDELVARLHLPSPSGSVEGERLYGLPAPLADVMRSPKATGFHPLLEEVRQRVGVGRVVTGAQAIPITIQRQALAEKPRPRPPAAAPSEAPTPPQQPPDQARGPLPAGNRDGVSVDPLAQPAPVSSATPEAPPSPAPETQPSSDEEDEAEEPAAPSPPATQPPAGPRKRPGRQTLFWSQRSHRDWERGQAEGTAVSTAGTLELAPSLSVVYRLAKERMVWAIAAGSADDVYLATGTDGRIYHRSPEGQMRLLFDAPEPSIQALALDRQGNLYAGAGPGGVIYRVSPAGKATVFFRTRQRYVLSLVIDASGNLYAGTGGAGRIFRVAPDGQGAEYFTTREPHVLRLALDSKGALLAGTAEQGVVYRITAPGQGTAVMDTGDRAVGGLAVDRDGRVVAGTAPRGLILREGEARPLLEAQATVLALACGPDGMVYAGAGTRLLCLRGPEDALTLECQDQGQLLALALDGRGKLWAGTGNGAGLYTLKSPGAQGTFASVIRDAETSARWGRLSWEAILPEGATVTARTRTGNTAEPDASWSPWSDEYTDASGTPVQSPPGRFVQYKVVLRAGKGGASPVLKSVTLSYLPENRPPRVEWRSPLVGTPVSGKVALSWTGSDPDHDTLTYELFYSADGGQTWQQMQPAAPPPANSGTSTPAGATKEGAPAQSQTPAAPTNPAGDTPKPEAKPAQANSEPPKPTPTPPRPGPVTGTSFRWETAGLADGPYLLKVVASDVRSNPGDARTAERVVGPVLVTNAKPKLTLDSATLARDAEGRVSLRGRVEDPRVPIASISYRVDGGEWLAATPADGMLDSPTEEFSLTTEKLSPGQHRIEVEAVNLAEGTATATIEAR